MQYKSYHAVKKWTGVYENYAQVKHAIWNKLDT